MSKMKQIVSNSLEDDIKQNVVYNSVKLSQYFNTKDPVPPKCKRDLVYRCTCFQSHIGETERRFEERNIDQNKSDKKLHICKHSSGNSHPHVLLNNF